MRNILGQEPFGHKEDKKTGRQEVVQNLHLLHLVILKLFFKLYL